MENPEISKKIVNHPKSCHELKRPIKSINLTKNETLNFQSKYQCANYHNVSPSVVFTQCEKDGPVRPTKTENGDMLVFEYCDYEPNVQFTIWKAKDKVQPKIEKQKRHIEVTKPQSDETMLFSSALTCSRHFGVNPIVIYWALKSNKEHKLNLPNGECYDLKYVDKFEGPNVVHIARKQMVKRIKRVIVKDMTTNEETQFDDKYKCGKHYHIGLNLLNEMLNDGVQANLPNGQTIQIRYVE